MLLLTLTAVRASCSHDDVAQLVLQGEIANALSIGTERFERSSCVADPAGRAVLGQLMGRCLLACGQDEEAEALFQRLLRVYESVSRPMVRWHAALDQGALLLHLNRPGRALECFNGVADDKRAPAEVRLEAMAGTAIALHRSGDSRTALRALDVARRLSDEVADRRMAQWVEALALEVVALQVVRTTEALHDHALGTIYRDAAGDAVSQGTLLQQLGAAARAFAAWPGAAQRLRHLQSLVSPEGAGLSAAAHMHQNLAWLRERRLAALETDARIEAAHMLMGREAWQAAGDVVAPLIHNEQQARRSAHGVALTYLMAQLHLHQGRTQDALRLYRHHTQLAVLGLRQETSQKAVPRFMAQPQATATGADAARMRLPPMRYRRAYQYIIERLHDEHLSVRQVAAHVNLTERSLQLAFRTHLGMTPAEVIRTQRMERIRTELSDTSAQGGVREAAARWGVTNRSSLVISYRAQFDETPVQTLRGGHSGHGALAAR